MSTRASLNLPFGALDHLRGLDRVGVMTGNRGRWPKIDEEPGVEDVTLLILEWLGEQGVNAMIRMDAERLADNAPAWTFAMRRWSVDAWDAGRREDCSAVHVRCSGPPARLRSVGSVLIFVRLC